MSDISKNDAVGFANSILAMQKENAELKEANKKLLEEHATLLAVVNDVRIRIFQAEKDLGSAISSRIPTSAPGRSDGNDHKHAFETSKGLPFKCTICGMTFDEAAKQ